MKEGFWALVAFIVAWAIAQVVKVVLLVIRGKEEWNFSKIMSTLVKSGGMPSGHVASLGGMATYIGMVKGFDGIEFAMIMAVTIIVAYDAVNVRYSVGEQGKLLKKLVHRRFKIAEGHTVGQVLVGAVIGVLVGVAVFLLTK